MIPRAAAACAISEDGIGLLFKDRIAYIAKYMASPPAVAIDAVFILERQMHTVTVKNATAYSDIDSEANGTKSIYWSGFMPTTTVVKKSGAKLNTTVAIMQTAEMTYK